MPIARLPNIKLNYEVQGAGEWLVLIGGFASGNWQAWGAHLTELAKHYRVLAFDNRGIGHSDAPDHPYSTRMMADDAIGLMDHLGIERAHLLGKSLGGCIAQWVALQQPSRIRSLAMTSTMARPGARATQMVKWWLASAQGCGYEALFSGLLTYFYSSEYFEANQSALKRAAENLVSTPRPLAGFLNTGHAALTHDTWDRLPEIDVPSLLVCGADDIITTARHSEQMAQRMPRARAHIVADALHGVMTERPESFQVVLDFFRQSKK